MSAWLRQNWKILLALVAGFVIVILLYLRTRGSGTAGTISLPPAASPPGGGDGTPPDGSGTPPPASWQNILAKVIPRPPGYGSDTPGQPGSGIPLFGDPNSTDLLTELPWNSVVQITGPAVAGRTVPGRGNLWVPVQQGAVKGWALLEDILEQGGQGGPGLDPALAAQNLGRAALSAQAASHRTALRSARLSRRLSHDAVQAAGESRRIFQESRGAAPIGGPLGRVGPRWR